MTLLLELLSAIIWPTVALVLTLCLRKPLFDLLWILFRPKPRVIKWGEFWADRVPLEAWKNGTWRQYL